MAAAIDLAVLRVMKRRKEWDKVKNFVPKSALDDHTKLILDGYRRYYDMHPNDEVIDMDVFRSMFFNVWNRTLTTEMVNAYVVLLDRCCEDVTPEQRATIVNTLIELELAMKAGNLIMEYEGGAEIALVPTLLGEVEAAKKKLEIISTAAYATVESLAEKKQSNVRYMWHLKGMAEHCRPVEGGDMIIVAGLTDVGKTSFTLNLTVMFTVQTRYPWLWFNNEGPKERIQKRAYGMMFGVGTEQIDAWEADGSLAARIEQIYGHAHPLRIYDVHGMSNVQLEDLIQRVIDECGGVGGVVWDMLDNVPFKGSSAALRTDQQLEEKYQWARQLGVIHDYPNIATSQQSENKEWQQWPAKHELKDSKVGKQGACDMLLFITQPEEHAKETFRYISAPKNKLAKPTAPRMRIEARFNKLVGCVYEDGRF